MERLWIFGGGDQHGSRVDVRSLELCMNEGVRPERRRDFDVPRGPLDVEAIDLEHDVSEEGVLPVDEDEAEDVIERRG